MNFRHRRNREEPEINFIPLIDVLLVLLIFFMVASTFRKESELKLQLPESSQQVTPPEKNQLELRIDRNERYELDQVLLGDKLSTEVLQTALAKALESNRERPLIISADAQTPHEAVVRALDAAGKIGITKVGISALPAKAP